VATGTQEIRLGVSYSSISGLTPRFWCPRRQAKCAPALVKPGAEVREYSGRVQAKTADGCAGEGFMDELVSVSGWC
jgi:hypothetical protein